jgi:hypothetical protein
MCSDVPIVGNVSKATEFSTNTVPSDTAISSWLTLVIGATAAMALPPQIAHAVVRERLSFPWKSAQSRFWVTTTASKRVTFTSIMVFSLSLKERHAGGDSLQHKGEFFCAWHTQ